MVNEIEADLTKLYIMKISEEASIVRKTDLLDVLSIRPCNSSDWGIGPDEVSRNNNTVGVRGTVDSCSTSSSLMDSTVSTLIIDPGVGAS